MQESMEHTGPQQHISESLLFIVLDIQLLFLIPSSKASCLEEVSHNNFNVQSVKFECFTTSSDSRCCRQLHLTMFKLTCPACFMQTFPAFLLLSDHH